MAANPIYIKQTRHIEIRCHYVREQVQRKLMKLEKIRSDDNPADAFTEPLDKARLRRLSAMIGVCAG